MATLEKMPEPITIPATRPLEPRRCAIVVGASSGIGAAVARQLAERGYYLALVARREGRLAELAQLIDDVAGEEGRARTYGHDVTDYEAVPGLFQQMAAELGGLDLVVYSAGIMPGVAANEFNFEVDASIIEVNLLGAMAWLNQAALRFSRAGEGHIVAISSMAGERGRVGFPAYSTSKAALNAYLEALRNRLDRQGVTVTTIRPGMVETAMLEGVEKKMWPISPEEAARQIVRAIEKRRQVAYVPTRWQWVALVIRNLPSVVFRRLNI